MMQKTVEKEKRKQRKTWVGLYTRITLTKEQKKQKENSTTDPYHWDIRIFAEFPRIVGD